MWQLRNFILLCCCVDVVFLSVLLKLPVVLSVDDYTRADFPPGFVFGAGSSAYQVEGAAFEDGRKPSIWDTFAHTPRNFGPQGNADVGCDQYHKYKEDVQLMVETGLEAYRFSISWSRLIPDGRGSINPKGLQYYNNLINELIKHGIKPHATLYHLDTPQALEDEYEGWLSTKIVKDFTAYADVCFKEFGDRVLHWTVLNEPNVFAIGGYDQAFFQPGRCSLSICKKGNSSTEPYMVVHNLLLAHSSAARLYRNKYKARQDGFVGANIYAPWFMPVSNSTEDVLATQRAKDYFIGWFLHPLVYGDYPDTVKKNAGTRIPPLTSRESKLIRNSFDFIGLNHYNIFLVKDDSGSLDLPDRDVVADMALKYEGFIEEASTGQSPIGMSLILEYIKDAYGNPPTYIHENGLPIPRNETLNDTSRVNYMHSNIGKMLDAIRNGSNTVGYFAWSMFDGFELLDGYKSSYGMYYVDLNDKQLSRYRKLSSHWYYKFLKGSSIVRYDNAEFGPSEFKTWE